MLARHLDDMRDSVYYIAGPSGMVAGMCDLLRSLGISEGNVKTEEFRGLRRLAFHRRREA